MMFERDDEGNECSEEDSEGISVDECDVFEKVIYSDLNDVVLVVIRDQEVR